MIDDELLPVDPDWDDVPAEFELLAGLDRAVIVLDEDGVGPATLAVVPGLFGHARRLQGGDLD